MEARAVLLTGTVGAGKTALATEVAAVLAARGKRVAAIDLDWLGWIHAGEGDVDPSGLIARNLQSIWPNYRAAGVERLVLARFVATESEVDALKTAVGDIAMTVVRVLAPAEVVEERLRRRDTGAELEEHLDEHRRMTELLDAAPVEDLRIANDRPIAEVAGELIDRLGWI